MPMRDGHTFCQDGVAGPEHDILSLAPKSWGLLLMKNFLLGCPRDKLQEPQKIRSLQIFGMSDADLFQNADFQKLGEGKYNCLENDFHSVYCIIKSPVSQNEC